MYRKKQLTGAFTYSLRRTSLIPIRRNDMDATDKREMYAQKYLDYNRDNYLSELDETYFYFVDEGGFNVSMRTRRGRSFRGFKAVQIVPGLRAKNILVCCAITKSGITKYSAETSVFCSNISIQL